MARDESTFIKFIHKEQNYVAYEDNNRGKILEEGIVRNSSTIIIYGVLLVTMFKCKPPKH